MAIHNRKNIFMKTAFFSRTTGFLPVLLGLALVSRGLAQNPIYGISSPGFSYQATNVSANTVFPLSNPTLLLTAGATYRLFISTAAFHPVVVATNSTGNFANPPVNFSYSGASPQNIFSGTVTITIPASNYPPVLYYQCNIHGFFGQINILPPPPPNQILSVAVTNTVMLVSTGTTNTWVFVPEYNSNLVNGAWAAVPGFNNVFAGGTNFTTFSRLEPICGPNVFLRVRQSPPN